MEGWQLAIVLKPFGLLVLFSFTHCCMRLVCKLPDSNLKRFLLIRWRV